MSKSVVVAILLDAENVYYVGQVVTGHVFVESSEQIKMRGIRLEFTSKAHVHWSEGTGDRRRSYNGNENYMDLTIDLIGSRSKDSELYLEPGSYRYPFNFVLPDHLPESFADGIGRVQHKMKAVIDRPWKIDDTAEILLTVIRLLDLNQEPPSLREPVVVQSEKTATGCCCCCCVQGITEINANINKGCFIATETILVSGEIINKSTAPVKYSTISFVQDIQYCATYADVKIYRTKHCRKILAETSRSEIRPGCSDTWSNIGFVVPPLPPSRLDGCRIINISYGIEITATFHKCCSRSSLLIPIVIGHVALRNDFQPFAITSQPQMNPLSYQENYNEPLAKAG